MEKKNKKKTAVIIGGALLLTIVVGTAVFLMTGKEEPEGYTINEENYQQIQEDIGNEVKEGYFETYMNTDWTFPDGTSETTNAVLGNSPNNKKPIRCEVLLEETDELVFSTGVLPVGAELPAFKLDADLDAGIYDAVCMIYLLDEAEDGTYIDYSSAGFHVTITVEN